MKKIAFVFPGQGSQYVGMARQIAEQSQVAMDTFREASDAIGTDLAALCFEGAQDELTRTENAQPAILTASIAMYRAFTQRNPGIRPHFVAGHSLGEYTALVVAGAIQFADAVRIVKKRGALMQQAVAANDGSMHAVGGLDANKVLEICASVSRPDAIVSVSGFNSATQSVISGQKEAVEQAAQQCKLAGGRTMPLRVSAPFHTSLMQPAAHLLKQELESYKFSPLNTTVIANVDGLPYGSEHEIIEKLTAQLTQPVYWNAGIQYMRRKQASWFFEVGPGKALKNLLQGQESIEKFSMDEEGDTEGFVNSISNNIKSLSSVLTRCLSVAAGTPNNNWNDDEYANGVIAAYESMRNLQVQMENDGRLPADEEVLLSVNMLRSILSTKGMQPGQISETIWNVLKENGTALPALA